MNIQPKKKVFFKLLFILFLERGEGREKERERNMNVWLLLVCPPLGTWPATQACAPTGNQTGDPMVHRLALNPLSHTSQGEERILKASREKETVTYKGVPIRLSADFSKETFQVRRGWKEIFQVMKGKDLYPRLLHPPKLSFRMEGQIKYFPDEVKLKEFIITKPLLNEMLKGLS